VRNAQTLLGGLTVKFSQEMYAYEVYPQRSFVPDAFVEIGDVLPSVVAHHRGPLLGTLPGGRFEARVERIWETVLAALPPAAAIGQYVLLAKPQAIVVVQHRELGDRRSPLLLQLAIVDGIEP
jgi:hypothetical protein